MADIRTWIADQTAGTPAAGDASLFVTGGVARKADLAAAYATTLLWTVPPPAQWTGVPYATIRDDADGAFVLNALALSPIPIAQSFSVDRLAVNVAVAEAAATPRLGLYASDSRGNPGALLVDAGTVDASTTGVKELTVTATVVPVGLVWFGIAYQGASSTLRLTCSPLDGGVIKTQHTSTTTQLTQSPGAFTKAGVSGALPDPAAPGDTGFARRVPIGAIRRIP